MKVTVASIFRNSTGYIPTYFRQIDLLRHELDVTLVLAEGDSSDHTGAELRAYIDPDSDDQVITVNHGGPNYGSIDLPERWQQIAKVVTAVISEVTDPGEVFIWVEADLVWDAETMVRLVSAGRCVAPQVLAGGSTRFYDHWGFRQQGTMFLPQPPYLPHPVTNADGPYIPIDSCGSCFAVPAEHFQVVRDWDGHWPFPAAGRLWLDTSATIYHP